MADTEADLSAALKALAESRARFGDLEQRVREKQAEAWDEGRSHGREETARRMTDGWLEADRWNAFHPHPYRTV